MDCDIFGDGYKVVMRQLRGYQPRLQLTMKTMEQVVNHLFPVHDNVIFDCDIEPNFIKFTIEELHKACEKIKNNRAPGPGNIPPEIIKRIGLERSGYVLEVYNGLAANMNFPAEWKKAKLVLLRKGDKPLENPASYRPICLLDVEGKLYEQLILGRLNRELQRSGGLSDRQYGFREGRQTADALRAVSEIARRAAAYSASHRRLCAVITLDVKNAFNSASWQVILEELRKRNIDKNLVAIIASYLSERNIILEAEDITKTISVNSGVPQGSVLGPTLWNVLYDDLLRMELPEEIELIGFADDVAMVITAKSENLLMTTANTGLLRVSNWLKGRQLKLAPEKTEAVLLTTKRKMSPVNFKVQGVNVTPCKAIKYLGVWLDTKLTYAEHISRTIIKADKTVRALTRLMPNIGGPRASKRRILACVVQSQLLYGAPAWHAAAENKKLMQKLSRVQRVMSIRVCSAYRTISAEGVGVIAGIPPIELLIKERLEAYSGEDKKVVRTRLMTRWQDKWERGVYGRWTWRLIPNIQQWIDRPFGEVDYYLTQALSGHGCFKKYLHNRRRAESDECTYCDGIDDVEHTLFVCPNWNEARTAYQRETGMTFNALNMMRSLVGGEDTWGPAYAAIRTIIETKEKDERL